MFRNVWDAEHDEARGALIRPEHLFQWEVMGVNTRNHNRQLLLHSAVVLDNRRAAEFLLQFDHATISVTDRFGRTRIDYANRDHNNEMLRTLVEVIQPRALDERTIHPAQMDMDVPDVLNIANNPILRSLLDSPPPEMADDPVAWVLANNDIWRFGGL